MGKIKSGYMIHAKTNGADYLLKRFEMMSSNYTTHYIFLIIFGCLSLFSFDAQAKIEVETEDASCNGKADGMATIKVTGITGDLLFSVDGASFQSSNVFSDLKAGKYTAVVKDANSSCEFSKEFEIKEPGKLSVSVSSSQPLKDDVLCNQEPPPVQLKASASGGEPGYTYSWPGGALSAYSTGMYTVTATDNTGCQASGSIYVLLMPLVCPKDPNDIIGPEGVGEQKWVSKSDELEYTIRFENDPKLASASAKLVKIYHPLDPDINMYSLRLGSFGFANHTFSVPEGKSFYSTRLDVYDSLGVMVDVIAGIDVTKRQAFWIFSSVDPLTGLSPADPFAGFLPVNDTLTHIGEGFARFTVKPASHTVTGDTIHAIADIIFDDIETITTPEIFNTIDAEAPISGVDQTPQVLTKDSLIEISVHAADDAGGSGLATFSLFLSRDSVNYELLAEGIHPDSAYRFKPELGQYCLYSIAKDRVSNNEPTKTFGEICFNSKKDGSVKLKEPLSAQTLCTGDTITFAWETKNASDLNLYFKDQGKYHTIALNVPVADSTFSWIIPDTLSAQNTYAFKIEDAGDRFISFETNPLLSLVPSLAPDIISSTGNIICEGNNSLLSISNSYSSYLWTGGETDAEISVYQPGVFKVITVDENGCRRTDSIDLKLESLPGKPELVVRGASDFCAGDSVIISAPHGYDRYLWNNGADSQDLVVKESGNYSVSIGNGSVCLSAFSDTVNITVLDNPDKPLVALTGDTSLCPGESVTLTASEGYQQYLWSDGRTGAVSTINSTGKYVLRVTDVNGCMSFSDTISIIAHEQPVKPYIAVSATGYCVNDTVILSAPAGHQSYQWSSGELMESVLVTVSGKFSVSYVDEFGCQSEESDTLNIAIHPLPEKPVIAVSGPDVFCKGDSVELIAPSAKGYRWSNGQLDQKLFVKESGSFAVALTDNNGCESPFSDPVSLTRFDIHAGEDQTAYIGLPVASCVNLQASSQVDSSSYSILWSTGDTTLKVNVCPLESSEFTLYATSDSGCESVDTVQVCVMDIVCTGNSGNNVQMVQMCDRSGGGAVSLCVPLTDVQAFLLEGKNLGGCDLDNPCDTSTTVTSNPTNVAVDGVNLKAVPNPFHKTTAVEFSLSENTFAVLKVYDLSGVEVTTLFKGDVNNGKIYEAKFAPDENVPNGMYIYKLTTESGRIYTGKLIYMK